MTSKLLKAVLFRLLAIVLALGVAALILLTCEHILAIQYGFAKKKLYHTLNPEALSFVGVFNRGIPPPKPE